MTKDQWEILSEIRNNVYSLVRNYNDLTKKYNEENMSENDATYYNAPVLVAFETMDSYDVIISAEPKTALDFIEKLWRLRE